MCKPRKCPINDSNVPLLRPLGIETTFGCQSLSTENRKRLHNTYILPHFDFGCVSWENCTHYLEAKLVCLQKRSARVILDCDFYTPSSTIFSDLKWMLFPERVIYI